MGTAHPTVNPSALPAVDDSEDITMSSAAKSMIWEFWRQSWLWICSVVIGGLAIGAIVRWIEMPPVEEQFQVHIHYMAIMFGSIYFPFLVLKAQFNKSEPDRIGFPRLLYVKPLSTRR